MSKNISGIPFTEIVERVVQLARLREDVKDKVRGIVNDVYVRDITRKEDWNFLLSKSYLSLDAAYNTGTVSASTGGTDVTFSGATIASTPGHRRLKIDNNNYIYDFTYVSSTNGTISPALVGDVDASGMSYWLYRSIYPLASDFEKFPKNGGLHQYFNGRKKIIPEKGYDYYTNEFSGTPADNFNYCKILGTNSAGHYEVELIPPPKTQGSLEYDYFRKLKPMKESTAGTITVTSASTTVVGSGTKFQDMNTGDYIRVDALGEGADSEWYRIASITSNTDMTLQMVFGSSSVSSAACTISSVPDMPDMLHPAILYGAITMVSADQNDPMVVGYKSEYASVLSDGKRIYKSRLYREDVATIAEEFHYRR